MKKANQVTPEDCRRAFDYDPDSGVLVWKDRPHIAPASNARFRGREAGTVMVTQDGKSYRKVCVDYAQILSHRVIWTMVNGAIPDAMEIDHADGNGLNNRLSNLRLVDHSENMKNCRLGKNNTSGFRGVRRAATAYIP